jgi:hypothetical protein
VEPALLTAFHQDLLQLIQVLDVSMALLFGGLAIQFIIQQRSAQSARIASTQLVASAPSPTPQIQVSR